MISLFLRIASESQTQAEHKPIITPIRVDYFWGKEVSTVEAPTEMVLFGGIK